MTPTASKDLPAARLVSREALFRGWRKVDRLRLEPRSLRDGNYGGAIDREVVLTGAVAAVLPYVPESDEILLVRQFRAGAFAAGDADPFLYEIPAGFIDAGESAEDCACREGAEETGAAVSHLEKIGLYYPTPGGSTESTAIYLGRIAAPKTGFFGLPEEGEEIETHLLPAAQVFDMLDRGEITNATAALALHWFARHHDAVRRKWLAT